MTFTPEEITAMAKEAGATKFYQERQSISQDNYLVGQAFLERFAALVAAKELEACAQVCEGFKQGNSATYIDDDWADMCAEAIRARGQKEWR